MRLSHKMILSEKSISWILRHFLLLYCGLMLFNCGQKKAGDGGVPSKVVENPSLDSLERLFKDVPKWISSVYDSASGGFYHNALMVSDTFYTADLQSTSFSLNVLFGGNIISQDSISSEFKSGLKNFVFNRFDEEEGYYLDPVYKDRLLDSERNLARLQGMAASILRRIEVEDEFAKPFTEKKAPNHLQSLPAFKTWLEHQNWDRVWTAFDHIAMQSAMIRRLPKSRADSIISYVAQYAMETQNVDGLWGAGQPMEIRFSGAAKYGTFCQNFDIKLPNTDKMYATLMDWFRNNEQMDFREYSGCAICVPRNALRLLYYIKPHLNQSIHDGDKELIVKQTTRMLRFYSNADGGFMKEKTISAIAPDDLRYGEYDSLVSDMNGTHLAITARSAIYDLLEMPVPKIHAEYEDIKMFLGNNKSLNSKGEY